MRHHPKRRTTSLALRPLVLAALFLASALPAILFACNGSSGSLAGGPSGGNGEGGPPAEDGGGSDVTPGSEDAPTSFIVDSGRPDTSLPLNMVDAADIPEGGARVTPGVIACGAQPTCNAFAAVQCCVEDDGGSACLDTSVKCPPNATSFTCNESADCVVGKVCCGDFTAFDAGTLGLGAQCATACGPPLPQLCRTNGECADGGKCRLQTCSDGNKYELCGIYSTSPDASAPFTCTAN